MFWFYISSAGPGWNYDDKWLQLSVPEGTTVNDLERVIDRLRIETSVRKVFENCIYNRRFLSGTYQIGHWIKH
ncbi:hypothetical protein KY328_04000 [Candidatus Woesearchaeota archaeon]|nr:hypothetical protein [Candidatus Woesearchaeota archaeon]